MSLIRECDVKNSFLRRIALATDIPSVEMATREAKACFQTMHLLHYIDGYERSELEETAESKARQQKKQIYGLRSPTPEDLFALSAEEAWTPPAQLIKPERLYQLCTDQLHGARTLEEVRNFTWYALGSIWTLSLYEAITTSKRQLWINRIEKLAEQHTEALSKKGGSR